MLNLGSQRPDWNTLFSSISSPENESLSASWYYIGEICDYIEEASKIYLYFYYPRQGERDDRVLSLVFQHGNEWKIIPYVSGEMRNALVTTSCIPSFRDPNQQLRINDFSWYGKLIRQLYDQRLDEQEADIQTAYRTLAGVLDKIFEGATESLKQLLQEAIFYNRISFRATANTRDDGHKQIMLFIDDGIDAPYYEKGSGIQSALIIGLFTHYCQSFHQGSSLLLAEEPEIYLHPQARRAIEGRLAEFVSYSSSQFTRQVILSTHSPEFLRTVNLDSITCMRKVQGRVESKVSQIRSEISDTQRRRWHQILSTKNSEMLFADHVILVEGGEEFIIAPLADLHLASYRWLDSHNVSVVRIDGKGRFKEYANILQEFGITYTILADFDFLRDSVNDFRNKLDESGLQALETVKQVIGNAATSVPKANRIKENLSPQTGVWVNLYNEVKDAIDTFTNGNEISEEAIGKIKSLWDKLQDRMQKSNISNLFSLDDPHLQRCLSALRDQGIFVLRNGELEDYLTDRALALEDSKDRRALLVGFRLGERKSIEDAYQWIKADEFLQVIEHVAYVISN